MRRIAVAALCLLPSVAMAQQPSEHHVAGTAPALTGSDTLSDSWSGNAITVPSSSLDWITFSSAGVSLGPNGEVKITSKEPLTDTAKRFWNAVAQVRGQPLPFPEIDR